MEKTQNMTHSIVISATNVVPEFPLGFTSVVVALAIMGVLLKIRKINRGNYFGTTGKMY
jgi:hypothetical protein